MFINPYTGQVMGLLQEGKNILVLPYVYIMNCQQVNLDKLRLVLGLLLFIVSVTEVILWPGGRKIIPGFKIKWDGHPKRLNFDIHKVIGIVVTVFLALNGFTDFCWNFYDQSVPIIHALTLIPKSPEVSSQPVSGQSLMVLSKILQRAEAAVPNAKTTYIPVANKPEGAITVAKKLSDGSSMYGQSEISFDQYTGKAL